MKAKKKLKIKKYPNGGRTPIKGTKEQWQNYQDSLDLYKQHLKIKPIYPELPQISKEEYDRLHLKEKGLTKYAFDEAQYREDKKSGKQIKSFEDYVYSSPDSSFYQHPRTIANDEYDVKYKGVRDVNKYSQDTEKFKIVLSDGSIKEPMSLYDGKPEWDDYNLFSPDYKTQRMYSKNYLNNKYELQNIWSQKIAPIRTEYFGKDSLIDMGGTNISSSSTGWYKYGEKPKFKETSNKNFKNYSIPYEARDVYAKPVQPIIYQPQDEDFQKVIQDGNNRAGIHFKLETRQKQNIENIQPRQLEQLQIQPINQELQKVPFSDYFSRERQNQELDSKQFGRKGKKDYFDKKTGRLLGTFNNGGNMNRYYADGGGISRFETPVQQPTGLTPYQLPFNELAMALASKQKAYDEQEANMAKQKAFLADLKSGYRTAGLPQEIQQEYNTKFQNYIGKDLTDPTIKRSLTQDIANLSLDPRLRTLAADIKQSALWDTYQQAHPDLAGAAVNPYKQGEQWIPAKDAQGNWLSEQQLNNWYGNITPYADYQKMVDNAFSKIHENAKNTIVEEDPTASFYTDKDGKEYYLSKKTGNKATYITPELPQWKKAAEEQAFLISQSKLPEANYFRGSFKDQINADPKFIEKYISTVGGKYQFNRTETSEDYTIKNVPGSGGGSKSDKQDPTIAKYPLSITTGQITDQNGNRITTPHQLSKVLEQSLGEDKDGNSNYDKSIRNIVNELQTNYGKLFPGLEFKNQSPGSTNIIVNNTTGGEIPAEVQTKVDAFNTKNEIVLQKLNGLYQVQKQIMQESGLDPNLSYENNLKKIFGEKGLKEAAEQAEKTLSNEKVKYSDDFTPNPRLSVEQNRNLANSQGKLIERTQEELNTMKDDFVLTYLDSKKHPSIEKYKEKMNEVLNGIEMMNEDAIPVGKAIKDNVKQETLMTVLTTALNDPVMLTDGQYIKYANKPDVSLSEKDKATVNEYMKDPKKTDLKDITYLYFDQNENEYKLAVNVPRGDGSTIVLEVGPKAIKNIEQFAADLDPDFHNLKLQGYNNSFFRDLKETNGTFAFSPKVDGIEKRNMAKELGMDESKINDYQIGVRRVLHPIQVKENSGEIYNLTPGSFYFTVPEANNIIIKPKNAKSIFQFNQEYNKLKAKYGDNLNPSKIEELIQYINTGPGLGIESIYSNQDYNRLQTYPKINSPKQ